MAWAEPTSEVSGFANWNTTKMCADTKHHEPFRFLGPALIRLRIPQFLPILIPSFLNLRFGSVSDENGLASPFDDDIFALWDAIEIDFNLCKSQNISGGGHRLQETSDGRLCSGGADDAH